MKILRMIALLTVLLIGLAGGALWFATRPTAAESPAPPSSAGAAAEPDDAAAGDPDALLRRLRDDGSLTLTTGDLTALTRALMSQSLDGREFLRISRDLQAAIDDNFVEIGGTFDLAALDETALSEDARTAVEQMRATVPFLLNGERYLGVRGTPTAVGGNIGFGADATLRIGTLGLPVGLLTFLGSEEEVAKASLALPDLTVTDVVIEAERLRIEARQEQP